MPDGAPWEDYAQAQTGPWQDYKPANFPPIPEGKPEPPLEKIGFGNTLGQEVKAVGSAIAGMPGAIYHSFKDPETEEERGELDKYGLVRKGKDSDPGRLSLGLGRMGVLPVARAAEDYYGAAIGEHPEMGNNALDVAPEALGSASGNMIGAKLAEVAPGAIRRTGPSIVRGVARGTNAVLAKAPVTGAAIGSGVGAAAGHATGIPGGGYIGAGIGGGAGALAGRSLGNVRVPGENFGQAIKTLPALESPSLKTLPDSAPTEELPRISHWQEDLQPALESPGVKVAPNSGEPSPNAIGNQPAAQPPAIRTESPDQASTFRNPEERINFYQSELAKPNPLQNEALLSQLKNDMSGKGLTGAESDMRNSAITQLFKEAGETGGHPMRAALKEYLHGAESLKNYNKGPLGWQAKESAIPHRPIDIGRTLAQGTTKIAPPAPGQAFGQPIDLGEALKQSLQRVQTQKAIKGNLVGTTEGARIDTSLFEKARQELGDKASIREIAQRAQELKDQAAQKER